MSSHSLKKVSKTNSQKLENRSSKKEMHKKSVSRKRVNLVDKFIVSSMEEERAVDNLVAMSKIPEESASLEIPPIPSIEFIQSKLQCKDCFMPIDAYMIQMLIYCGYMGDYSILNDFESYVNTSCVKEEEGCDDIQDQKNDKDSVVSRKTIVRKEEISYDNPSKRSKQSDPARKIKVRKEEILSYGDQPKKVKKSQPTRKTTVKRKEVVNEGDVLKKQKIMNKKIIKQDEVINQEEITNKKEFNQDKLMEARKQDEVKNQDKVTNQKDFNQDKATNQKDFNQDKVIKQDEVKEAIKQDEVKKLINQDKVIDQDKVIKQDEVKKINESDNDKIMFKIDEYKIKLPAQNLITKNTNLSISEVSEIPVVNTEREINLESVDSDLTVSIPLTEEVYFTEINQNVVKDKDKISNSLVCTFCNNKFTSKNGLNYHIKYVHSEEKSKIIKPYKCPFSSCNKKYKNKNGLYYHLTHRHLDDTDDVDALYAASIGVSKQM